MTPLSEWSFYVRVLGEIAVDSGDGLTFELHGKDAQASPAPAVYVNGVLQLSGYTIADGDQNTAASVTFNSSQTGNVVTVDYRWKYECTPDQEAGVWEADKDVNIKPSKDANGRDMVAVSYTPAGSFKGVLTFEYVSKTFWQEWQIIAENAYAFDIERTSDMTNPRTLYNCIALKYPRWVEVAFMPDLINVGIEFQQL